MIISESKMEEFSEETQTTAAKTTLSGTKIRNYYRKLYFLSKGVFQSSNQRWMPRVGSLDDHPTISIVVVICF